MSYYCIGAVWGTCSTDANCTATIETCDTTAGKCKCAATYINKGDGTCITEGEYYRFFLWLCSCFTSKYWYVNVNTF